MKNIFSYYVLYIIHGIQEELIRSIREPASERFFVSSENHTNFICSISLDLHLPINVNPNRPALVRVGFDSL